MKTLNSIRSTFFIAVFHLAVCCIVFGQGATSNQSKDTSDKADKNLRGSARINPSTLAMEFGISLASYPGRSGNEMSFDLNYSSKLWRMVDSGSYWYNQPYSCDIQHVSNLTPRYGEHSQSGWTSSFIPPVIEEKFEIYDENGDPYRMGVEAGTFNLSFLQTVENSILYNVFPSPGGCGWACRFQECFNDNPELCWCHSWEYTFCRDPFPDPPSCEPTRTTTPVALYYVKRAKVRNSSGSMSEFRASDVPIYCGTTATGCDTEPNGTYLSTDGSGMRLERNSNGSTLFMPNGTKVAFPSTSQRIGDEGARLFYANNSTDVNGNITEYSSSTASGKLLFTKRDTLGRELTDALEHNYGQPGLKNGPVEGKTDFALPGLDGEPRSFSLEWQHLKPVPCPPGSTVNCGNPEGALEVQSEELFHYTKNICWGNAYPLVDPNGNQSNPENNHPDQILFPNSDIGVRGCNPLASGSNITNLVAARFNPVVLAEMTLPDGRSYRFKYNQYGEITKVVSPTGAYETFKYGWIAPLNGLNNAVFDQTNRGVSEHRVYEANGQLAGRTLYSATIDPTSNVYKVTTVSPHQNTDPAQTPMIPGIRSERSLYVADPADVRFGYDDPLAGMPFDERVFDENGDLRSRTLTDYTMRSTVVGTTYHPNTGNARRDLLPFRTATFTFEPGSQHALATFSKTEFDDNGSADAEYFSHLNVKRKKAYNYAAVTAASVDDETISWPTIESWFPTSKLESVSEMDYQYDASYKSRGILGLPTETRLYDAQDGNALIALSQASYDEVGQYYSMVDYGTTTGYVAPTGSYAHLRGKPTTKRTWNFDANSWITTHTQFDNFGNVRKVWDTSGDQTRFIEYEYDSNYNYAYVTKTKAPAPDPTGIHGMNTGSEVTETFDFNTGLSLSVTDANGQTAFTEYDALLRPIRITPPSGGAISETVYNDAERWVKSRQQIDAVNWAESTTYFDTLGRPFKSKTRDQQGDIYSLTEYDKLGRVFRTSNPYREGETVYWSKPRYDAAGRVVETFAPAIDGQTGTSSGTVQFGIVNESGLLGAFQISTDASGRKRRVISGYDGILRVDEPTAIGGTVDQDLGAITSPNQPTSFSYNSKGELTKITQGKSGVSGQPFQNRYFKYDSFGRLIKVRQPEQTPNTAIATTGNPENNQWTASYAYDVLGNVISMTDAKNTTITTEYDKAGRTVKRTYSDGTPQAEFFYDGKGLSSAPAFSRGSITMATNGVSEDRFTEFDNHGRLKASQQLIDGQSYEFLYKYNLSGGLVEQTYPSGRIVRNYLDQDGGLNVVTSKASNGLNKVVASNFDYTAVGGIKKMKLGNGLWETSQVNERMQLTQVGLGTTATNNNLFKIDYEYGEISNDHTSVDTGKNVGMIARTTTTIPTTSFVQTYKYDEIARLTEAKEKTGSTTNWQQTFGYDIFGNRTSLTQSINGSSIPNTNINHPTIDPANNRFTTGQGYTFDANGNLIQDAEGRSFAFDGNDKQTEVRNASNDVIGTYYYDASGARVKKVTNIETTVFVYDAAGALAAEYSTQVETSNPQENYLTTDYLGSPRVITDKSGNVVARRDFMPFGEELGAGVGTRSTTLNYAATGADTVRKRFTGYEKDPETGLDFAEARMYQNQHGRFTAVDPLMASASPGDPQTFNRYTYTGNNPINRTDPAGLKWCREDTTGNAKFTGEGAACENGWTSFDDQERRVSSGGNFNGTYLATGQIAFFNSNGSIDLREKPSESDQVERQNQNVVQGQNEVIESSATELATNITIRPRADLPLPPCVPGTGCLDVSKPSPPSLDTSQNEELNTVKTIKAAYNLCSFLPGIGMACGVASAIVNIGQGNLGEAGVSLAAGVIPGLKVARNTGRLFKTAEEVTVYVSKVGKDVQYAGITNNLLRRAGEHFRSTGITIEPLIEGLSRAEARGVEQALVRIHGLQKNGGTLLNKINSIAKSNPKYNQLTERGFEILRENGYTW